MKYELHNDLDADFPLIFGCRILSASHPDDAYLHWHDCIEVVYCEYGQGWVISGSDRIFVEEGDIAIVNSGDIHDGLTNPNAACIPLIWGVLYTALWGWIHIYLF